LPHAAPLELQLLLAHRADVRRRDRADERTASVAAKQCGSFPAMNTVSLAANGRTPYSDFTTPLPRT
jgi:hypothetical protein